MTAAVTSGVGLLALAIWLYLLLGRGGFWLARERDDREEAPDPPSSPENWPRRYGGRVPARDEADVIARSIGSLLAQDYPGPFRVVLVDDNSGDGTGDIARTLVDASGRLEVLTGAPLPAGWTGKLWAQSQGVARAAAFAPDYLLLTDAGHRPRSGHSAQARRPRRSAMRLVLTSLMALLTVETWPERLLIPAFVFFFDMLYPFAWVNDPRRKMAAAAGGVMLAKRTALEAAGGLEAIRWKIIDDCSLGALMKRQGPIWLGLTHRACSLRPYAGLGEIGRMVSCSAYRPAGLLALAADRNPERGRDGDRLPRGARAGGVRRRPGPLDRSRGVGGHDAGLPAHAALLPPLPPVGPGPAADRRDLHRLHPQVRPRQLARRAAASGKAGPRRSRPRNDGDRRCV